MSVFPPANRGGIEQPDSQRCFRIATNLVVLILTMALAASCGVSPADSHVTISGHVTIDGSLIQNGTITFIPEGHGAGGGGFGRIRDGQYTLNEVPLGQVAFTFSATTETGKQISGPGGQPEPERINIVPELYRREGIQREITSAGSQDFELESHPSVGDTYGPRHASTIRIAILRGRDHDTAFSE